MAPGISTLTYLLTYLLTYIDTGEFNLSLWSTITEINEQKHIAKEHWVYLERQAAMNIAS